MENKIDYKTLLNFSAGKYSFNDYLKVKQWFVHVRDDQDTEDRLFEQWKGFADIPSTDPGSLRSIFEKIQYRILLEEKKHQKERNLWYWYRQVAAVLIPIVACTALFYLFSRPEQPPVQPWVELNVPEGARIEFLLPDSTSGWLNSGARLKYPAAFGSHRKVELTGEAFFNVVHRDHSDFTVEANGMEIKVFGTQFNVAAYSNEPVTEVVLSEGKVEIKDKAEGFSRMLQPGDKMRFNRETKSLNVSKVNPDIYTAWTDGYLVIDNEPLGQIAQKLGRWYNAEVVIQDEALKSFRFNATFSDEPLEEVLRFIAMTTPITYQIGKRDFDTNGVLKKRQVTIKLKR